LSKKTLIQDKKQISLKDFKDEVLNDYKIAKIS
jgi:hypothetical protein